jgi:tRNA(fMet)-specific endonuclease VapC
MKKSILDTDIVTYYFKRNPKVVSQLNQYLSIHGFIYISRITVIEILGGLKAKSATRQIEDFKTFIAQHQILDTSEVSADISADIFAELWQKGRHSGNYDILIAGIAMAHDLTLVSNNTKDYQNISGLSLDNWI